MNESDICNWALLKCGQRPLSQREEQESEGRKSLCLLPFSFLHSSLLRSYCWSFATHQEVLSRELSKSIGTAQLLYPLPHTCLKILSLPEGYRLGSEGVIGEKQSPQLCEVRYIKRTPVSECDPLFCEALAFFLGSELSVFLCGDQRLSAFLRSEGERIRQIAQDMDAIEVVESREY